MARLAEFLTPVVTHVGFPAPCAFFLCFSFVGFHVGSEIAGEGEFLVAQLACMRLVSCVEEKVIFEVGVFGETSGADIAPKWPRSIVDVHVGLEVSRCREGFGTEAALVRFFLYVCHPMIVKIGAGCKPLPTDLTLMRFFSTVYSPVRVE